MEPEIAGYCRKFQKGASEKVLSRRTFPHDSGHFWPASHARGRRFKSYAAHQRIPALRGRGCCIGVFCKLLASQSPLGSDTTPCWRKPAWGPRQKILGEATRHGRPKETGNKGMRVQGGDDGRIHRVPAPFRKTSDRKEAFPGGKEAAGRGRGRLGMRKGRPSGLPSRRSPGKRRRGELRSPRVGAGVPLDLGPGKRVG
jgi:hypothetical protein